MKIVRTVADLRAETAAWRDAALTHAVVPTMGGLHEGHLSLIRCGLSRTDRAMATLFVNPTQFAAGEDLDAYPRDEGRDASMLEAAGCNLLFAPEVDEVYPPGFATRVIVDGLTDCLCGARRAGHFDGVSQVVTKLLNQAQANVAVFGEKDWQQLAVVRRLALDLDIPTKIVGAPTIRESDGLAMSSRNRYLTVRERAIAIALPSAMKNAIAAMLAGASCADATKSVETTLLAAGFQSVDYVEVRSAETLQLVENVSVDIPARIFAAAHLGKARLIDNMAVA